MASNSAQSWRSVIEVKVGKSLSAVERTLVLYQSLENAQTIFKLLKDLPRIKTPFVLNCDCLLCKTPISSGLLSSNIANQPHLLVRAAGYNSSMNLVYYDVYVQASGTVIMTLECIPTVNQRGIVKFVARSYAKKVLFSAVHLPKDDILAFYDESNFLFCFQWKSKVLYPNQRELLTIREVMRPAYAQSSKLPIHYGYFDILSPACQVVATIQRVNYTCTQIHLPPGIINYSTHVLRIAPILGITLKIYSVAYKLDRIPIPEITYCYKNEGRNIKELF